MLSSGTVSQNSQYRPRSIQLQGLVSSECGDTTTSGTVAQVDQYRPRSISLQGSLNPHSSNGLASHTIPQNPAWRPSSISLQALDYTCAVSCEGSTTSGGYSWPNPDISVIELGAGTGETWFEFDALTVPDKFAINWNGNWVIESGFIGGPGAPGSFSDLCALTGENIAAPSSQYYKFDKNAAQPEKCFLYVWGPYTNTAWDVFHWCPGDEKSFSVGPGPSPCSGGSLITLPDLDAEGNEV